MPIKSSKLPTCWITIKGISQEEMDRLRRFLDDGIHPPPVIMTNKQIEIWTFDKKKHKWVRLAKDPPIKEGFWRKLRKLLKKEKDSGPSKRKKS